MRSDLAVCTTDPVLTSHLNNWPTPYEKWLGDMQPTSFQLLGSQDKTRNAIETKSSATLRSKEFVMPFIIILIK